MIVRALQLDDKPVWQDLWNGYLAFYEVELGEDVTHSTWLRVTGREGGFFALVAENDKGAVIGFAHCLMHLNTWDVAPRCYLEDLYVASTERGGGVGRALMEGVAEEAERLGANHVYWFTDKENETARLLYDRIGTLSQFVRYDKKL